MKRLLAILLTVVLAVGMLPLHDAQADYLTAVVKGGWLRLRQYASYDAPTITSYYTGTQVTIQGTSGAWYHVITPDGRTGYMLGAYLTVGASTGDENITAWVTSNNGKGVRLRTGPSTAYGVIGLYSVGTKATILRSGTYWHYVKIGGQKGYMMAAYLTREQVAPPASTGGYTAYVTSSNGKGVNLRYGAGLNYGVIGLYDVGTRVTVVTPGSSWHYIDINGTRGFMMAKYLTTTPVSAPSDGSYTAYVISDNGLPVRMRAGAGTGYSVIGRYSVGTPVLVLRHNATWDYIRVGNTEGYMMNKYLTTETVSTQVTKATITPSKPVPGDVLRVSITPSDANVSYEWVNDSGVLLSTASKYTVKNNDVGDKIRVRVIGKSGYTGSATSAYVTILAETEEPETIEVTGVALSTSAPRVGQTITAQVEPEEATVTYGWYRSDGTKVGTQKSYNIQPEDEGLGLQCKVTGKDNTTGSATSEQVTVLPAQEQEPAKQVTGVTIDNTRPYVGLKLTASVSPAEATVSYGWYRADGTKVGTQQTYKVSEGDVGSALYCKVVGKDDYTGTVTSGWTSTVVATDPDAPIKLSGTVKLHSSIMPGVTLQPSVSVNCNDINYQWMVGGTVVSSAPSLQVTEAMAGKKIVLVISAASGSGYTGSLESNTCTVLQTTTPGTRTDL